MAYQIRSNLHLPYGGELEGADDDKRSNIASPIQPPPSLPRRGGTDTFGYMIFVSSRQIINGLSMAIVTVPPPKGRDGYLWLHDFRQ